MGADSKQRPGREFEAVRGTGASAARELAKRIGMASSTSSGERQIREDVRWASGRIVARRYRIEEQVGEGGMGRVFAAVDQLKSRRVAIKAVTFEGPESETLGARFRREVELMTLLRGPGVVELYDHAIDRDCAYLAMELLIGESLQNHLARIGRLDVRRATLLLRGVGRGLSRAHRLGVIHRDIKPANIFLCGSNVDSEEAVRLIDFGIARDLAARTVLTGTGVVLGSPHYVSPEQARGVDIDHRSDLWSLAVILYRALTGLRPFEGTLAEIVHSIVAARHIDPTTLVPTLPAGVDAFFARALAKDVKDRFPDCEAMLEGFEKAVGEDPAGSAGAREIDTPRAPRATDPTAVALASYETYAALVTADRVSGYPTLAFSTRAIEFEGPAPAASEPDDDRARSKLIRSEPGWLERWPVEAALALMLLTVVGAVVLWVVLRRG